MTVETDILERLGNEATEGYLAVAGAAARRTSIDAAMDRVIKSTESRGAIAALRRVGCQYDCAQLVSQPWRGGTRPMCHRCRILAEEIAKAETLLQDAEKPGGASGPQSA